MSHGWASIREWSCATERCGNEVPTLRDVDGRRVACHYAEDLKPWPSEAQNPS